MTLPTRNVETFSSPVNTSNGKIDANTVRGNDNVLGQRINATTLDVRRFGAIGDGMHDDTDALLDAVESRESIIVARGNTVITETTLSSTQEGISLSGRGTIMLADGANCSILRLHELTPGSVGAYYSWVNELTLDGNGANQTVETPILDVENGAYARMQGLHVFGSKGGGIRIRNFNQSVLADECNLANSFVFSNGTYGVLLDYGGSPVQGLGDCMIGPNNHINYNGTYGLHVHGGYAHTISGNNILTNGSHGIYLEGIPGVLFVNRTQVIGNQVRNNGGSGMYTFAQNTVSGGAGLIIALNQFHYNNAALTGSSNLDVFDTDYPIIGLNFCGDTDFTPRALYGLQLSRVANGVLIGNTLVNNATGHFLSALSTYFAFANTPIIAGPSVAGSRGGNAALASLLTQLGTLGVVTDNTTA